MSTSRRRAMRCAHAKRPSFCSCGTIVHGNGGRAAHGAMHVRAGDGHRYMVEARWHALMASLKEPVCADKLDPTRVR